MHTVHTLIVRMVSIPSEHVSHGTPLMITLPARVTIKVKTVLCSRVSL